jgi:tRNA(Ile)-lysidine synthase
VIRKVKKVKKLKKDKKIKEFYSKFRDIVFKNIKKDNFALAVSGGSDSLCMAYFSKMYASEFKNKIHILIVNHNLRKESHKEAAKVKKILKKKGIRG